MKELKKIDSFTIDHTRMKRGVFVSRRDFPGSSCLTTFDIRMKQPNEEPVLNIAPLHTIEHLGATFLRNHETWADKTIYFGPMGCRTGFYLILEGTFEPDDVFDLMKELFLFMSDFEGEIPGATAKDCGNYLDQNLPMAKWEAEKFFKEVLEDFKEENKRYPE